jgi:hypothetical protein
MCWKKGTPPGIAAFRSPRQQRARSPTFFAFVCQKGRAPRWKVPAIAQRSDATKKSGRRHEQVDFVGQPSRSKLSCALQNPSNLPTIHVQSGVWIGRCLTAAVDCASQKLEPAEISKFVFFATLLHHFNAPACRLGKPADS